MNWYIALGIKIFVGNILIFQASITLCTFGRWLDDLFCIDENNKKLLSIAIIGVLSSCITIPIACWIFNL